VMITFHRRTDIRDQHPFLPSFSCWIKKVYVAVGGFLSLASVLLSSIHCFVTVGWVTVRASVMYKRAIVIPKFSVLAKRKLKEVVAAVVLAREGS